MGLTHKARNSSDLCDFFLLGLLIVRLHWTAIHKPFGSLLPFTGLPEYINQNQYVSFPTLKYIYTESTTLKLGIPFCVHGVIHRAI